MLQVFCFIFLGVFVFSEFVAGKKGICGISPAVERYQEYHPNRIFGGEKSQDEDFPWSAFQVFNSSPICSGTIIHKRWILTAAHCFKQITNLRKYAVLYGAADVANMEVALASNFYIHPDYATDPLSDIALVKLRKPLKFSEKVQPICLDSDVIPEENEILTMAGMGANFKKMKSNGDLLMFSETFLQDSPITFRNYSFEGKILESEGVNHAVLPGDSGGSLMAIRDDRFFEVGIARSVLWKEYENETLSANFKVFHTSIWYFCPWIMETTNNQVRC